MLIMGRLAVFHSLIFLLGYHPWGENDFKILEHGSEFLSYLMYPRNLITLRVFFYDSSTLAKNL